ncbi:DUF7544 domain-containing protein [Natronorubrum halophilum]|uniref:DUF7544 domain-containing protein n=1 Tax=Natronorubrum halophilum TaxID=1702106 RepID=UPI000EF731DB|nr:hypothetical protein [Natronorubrum halophilum]
MYAIDNLSDSLAVTKRYLDSLGFGGWLKVAVVVVLLGGIGLTSQLFNLPFSAVADATEESDALWVVLLVSGVGIGIYAAFRYLVAILEFVFVESLRTEAIHFRRYARANLKRGLWLVLFRAALWAGLFIAIAIPVVAVVFLGDISAVDELSLGQIAAIGLSAFAAFVGWGTIYTLTTAFVVPIMLQQECGPIGAWRRFAPVVASNWSGTLAYLLITWLIGFAFWMLFAVIGFVVSIFGAILFFLVILLFTAIHPNLAAVAVGLFILAYLGYRYVVAVIETPVRGYVRYYALLILGDTDETLDLIPEQRGAVRSDPTTSTEPAGVHGRRETTGWGGGRDARDDPADGPSSSDPFETDVDDAPSWEAPTVWGDSSEQDDGDGWGRSTESARDPNADDSSDDDRSPWIDSAEADDGTDEASDEPDETEVANGDRGESGDGSAMDDGSTGTNGDSAAGNETDDADDDGKDRE